MPAYDRTDSRTAMGMYHILRCVYALQRRRAVKDIAN